MKSDLISQGYITCEREFPGLCAVLAKVLSISCACKSFLLDRKFYSFLQLLQLSREVMISEDESLVSFCGRLWILWQTINWILYSVGRQCT